MSNERYLQLELGYSLPARLRERFVQSTNAWEPPRLPDIEGVALRRWASTPTWTPPDGQLLVRHRSLDGRQRVVTNDRRSPEGFTIDYDLGLVHQFAQPGTQRLIVTSDETYFQTPFEGGLAEGFKSLGYIEEAPLPMLDALELRRYTEIGQNVLVAGPDDPLYNITTPIGVLGFIESYPINPRHPPNELTEWGLTTLLRTVDISRWRHGYDIGQDRPSGTVALGGLWKHGGPAFTELRRLADGRIVSELASVQFSPQRSLTAKVRWAAAPLTWTDGRPRAWAARAAAGRFRRLVNGDSDHILPDNDTRLGAALLGYVRREQAIGWSPIFSATHPAIMDQYVTRSEIEATDMGYAVDGILGYVLDRFADRRRDAMPPEVKWASRFGQRRRYVEGYNAF